MSVAGKLSVEVRVGRVANPWGRFQAAQGNQTWPETVVLRHVAGTCNTNEYYSILKYYIGPRRIYLVGIQAHPTKN